MDEQDKQELEALCRSHEAETAGRWLNRMHWPEGHEKMISFGAALEVRGTAKSVWCYHPAELDTKHAVYYGVPMTWERWAGPILEFLTERHRQFSAALCPSGKQKERLFTETLNQGMMMLFYQNGLYMTLPGEQTKILREWVYQYLSVGCGAFPYSGAIPDGGYSFTIDFAKDTEIVRAYDLKTDMAQYNRDNNANHNKDMAYQKTKERFETITGGAWTTQEILAQGVSRKTLDKFVKYGLIRRLKQGHYVRNFV